MNLHFGMLKPDPPAATQITDPEEVRRSYRYWQNRILFSSMIGYALFYFVRKNLSVAMPAMEDALGISKTNLGLFLTMHGLLYGVSKFANGMIGDRANARWFMVLGLICSAIVNVFFGLSTAVVTLGLLWVLNGWFQGMGFPPCARLLTHWFSPKVLATRMSLWNASHSIGASLVVVLCGYLVSRDWRLCFFVPAGIALCGALFLAFALRDTPESLGLPEVPGTEEPDGCSGGQRKRFRDVLRQQVFSNPYIWLIALANFFVYTVRYGILDWGPTFLTEVKHVKLSNAGWMVAAFEVAGITGMLTSGWLTDKLFGGRGSRVCLMYMALSLCSILAFWKISADSVTLNVVFLSLAGFFIYGPQCLVGIAVANLATKRAAATAVGLTGLFGYASTVVSGVGVGYVAEHYGWDKAFLVFAAAAVIGMLLFSLCWFARPDGYGKRT